MTFFDHYLKGDDNEREDPGRRSRSRCARKTASRKTRVENEWPLARTQYTKLYLDAAHNTMQTTPVAQTSTTSYNPIVPELGEADRAMFDIKFDKPTELTGYMKLRVFMSCADDRRHGRVRRPAQTRQGRRISCRSPIMRSSTTARSRSAGCAPRTANSIPAKSTEWQPVHPHTREQKIPPGEIVPLDIEIWPSGTLFEAGETLRLIVQGGDLNRYPTDRSRRSISATRVEREQGPARDPHRRAIQVVSAGASDSGKITIPTKILPPAIASRGFTAVTLCRVRTNVRLSSPGTELR